MNPLLRSDFEQIDKNFIKKLRRKIIQQIIFIRKSNKLYGYGTIYNFTYFHIMFSLLFVLLPFVCFTYKLNDVLTNEKNNFLNYFLEEKFIKHSKKNLLFKNSTYFKDNNYFLKSQDSNLKTLFSRNRNTSYFSGKGTK